MVIPPPCQPQAPAARRASPVLGLVGLALSVAGEGAVPVVGGAIALVTVLSVRHVLPGARKYEAPVGERTPSGDSACV
ncbi:hypothetical protein [Streptomyces noursei]|uniref:hypothetical protein n=1 Tax=Streptomyces noursei TaxID=1971 RepID=UPI00082BBDAA